jgi:hypothetical protein
VPGVEPPEPSRLSKVVWLEPLPDALLGGVIDAPLGTQRPATSRPNPSPWIL